jgi:sulfoxide reductase heme-binding subunit YedZ
MNLSWLSVRGSGLVAFSLLAAATMWGLLLSSKTLARKISTKNLTFTHEALAVGSLLATIIHIVALLTDQFVGFTLADILIPGSSTWRPSAVALGIVAMYGMLLTTSTFYMRRKIGQDTWRAIHYLTYGVFTAALLHGIKAGTDSHGTLAFALYGGTAVVVVALTIMRVVTFGSVRKARTPRSTSGSRAAVQAARGPRPVVSQVPASQPPETHSGAVTPGPWAGSPTPQRPPPERRARSAGH